VVKLVIASLLLASTAHAEMIPIEVVAQPPSWNLLGTRIMGGTIEIAGTAMDTWSIGVAMDRPLFGAWRALAEYEYVWIGPADRMDSDAGVGSLSDSGHRVHLGMRHRVAEKTFERDMQVFCDGELGAGMMLVDRRSMDAIALPHAFVGARVGFSLLHEGTRWDYELIVRGLFTEEHPARPGFLFGVGLAWGD
jgi:hypothetical protein